MKKIYSLILLAVLCCSTAWAGELKIGSNDGAQKNAPVYTSDADRYQYHNQTIYLATELTALAGQQITKITFYERTLTTSNKPKGKYENVQISLLEVANSSHEDLNFISTTGAQVVYTGSIDATTQTTLELTLSSAYVYKGGNLLVDVQKTQPSGGSYGGPGFQASEETAYYVLYGAGTTSGLPSEGYRSTSRPVINFTYEAAPSSSCADVKAPVASEITATSAKLTWEKAGEVDNYQFECVRKGGTPAWAAAAAEKLTVTLDTLKADTEYEFYVRSYCGAGDGEQGIAKKVAFTTEKSCYAPTSLAVPEANITSTSAKVTWSASGKGETEYQYTYGAYGSTPDWSKAVKTSEKEATLNELTPQSLYQVWVRSYCAEADQSAAETEYFATACGAVALPFNEDFSADIDCWTLTACHASTGVSSGAFRFYYTSTPPQYLISPELTTSSKGVKVEFDYYAQSATYEESFKVGYSTTTNDVAAFSWGEEKKTTNNNSYYPDHYSDILPAGVKYIAIQCTSNYKYYLFIDNFSAEEYEAPSCATPVSLAAAAKPDGAVITWLAGSGEKQFQYKVGDGDWTLLDEDKLSVTISGLASGTERTVYVRAYCSSESQSSEASVKFTALCPAPTALKVSDLATKSATLSWTAAEDITKYQYIVLPKDAAEDWSGAKEVSAVTVNLSELTANTAYDAYVRSYYSEVSQSASVKISFTTNCEAISVLPWSENFDGLTDLPNCWALKDATKDGDPSISVDAGSSITIALESEALFFNSKNTKYGYALLPEFEAALSTLEIVFSYKAEHATNSGSIDLGYFVGEEFTLLKAYAPATTMTTIDPFELKDVPAGARLAFRYKSNSTYLYAVAVDNIIIRIIGSATGIESIQNTEIRTLKAIENGQLIIIRDGEKFNAQGAKIK